MMQKRMETLMQKLPAGTDAALIQSDVNRRYLTGMQSSAGTVLCFRDGAYLIIDFRYIEKARECVKTAPFWNSTTCMNKFGNCSGNTTPAPCLWSR